MCSHVIFPPFVFVRRFLAAPAADEERTRGNDERTLLSFPSCPRFLAIIVVQGLAPYLLRSNLLFATGRKTEREREKPILQKSTTRSCRTTTLFHTTAAAAAPVKTPFPYTMPTETLFGLCFRQTITWDTMNAILCEVRSLLIFQYAPCAVACDLNPRAPYTAATTALSPSLFFLSWCRHRSRFICRL